MEKSDDEEKNAMKIRIEKLEEAYRIQGEALRIERKKNGSYNAVIGDIWDAQVVEYDEISLNALQKLFPRDEKIYQWYQVPGKMEAANYPGNAIFSGISKKDKQNKPSMAHLIPKDRTCSFFWGLLIDAITGFSDSCGDKLGSRNSVESSSIRHFIEGHSIEGRIGDINDEKFYGIKHKACNFLKLPDSHGNHFDHVNDERGFLIVPVWKCETLWVPGTPYSVLVVANSDETYQWMNLLEVGEWVSEASEDEIKLGTEFLCQSVQALAVGLACKEYGDFLEKVRNCSEEDLNFLLSHSSGSLSSSKKASRASSQVSDKSNGGDKSRRSNGKNSNETKADTFKKKAAELADARANIIGKQNDEKAQDEQNDEKAQDEPKFKSPRSRTVEGQPKSVKVKVKAPFMRAFGGPNELRPVLKVDLGKYFCQNGDDNGEIPKIYQNSIPDPVLVGLKAAAGWSSYFRPKLLQACGDPTIAPCDEDVNDCDEESSTCSVLHIKEISFNQGEDDGVSVLSQSSFSSIVFLTQSLAENPVLVTP